MNPGQAQEPELLRALFNRIYEAEASFVWTTLRRLGVPRHMLEDATQDAFLVVHRRLGDFDPARPVRAWLFAIVVRVARDHRRRIRRKDAPLAPLDGPTIPATSDDPLAPLLRNEAADRLNGILDRMSEKHRVVFVLAELEELSSREIGDILDVNANTISTRLRAARRHFDDLLARVMPPQPPPKKEG